MQLPNPRLVYKDEMFFHSSLTCVVSLGLALNATPNFAQEKPAIAGDYTGTLGPLHLKLHIKADPDGATLPSDSQESRRW